MMIESEYNGTIDGKEVSLYYEGWWWRVWMEGKGTVGIGSNKENAIADAEETTGQKMPWNLDIVDLA